ncbi:hypothetical protein C8R43DRAFT_1104584 [Mycena crocata]|nr:hypothetical protein C8R43DRAFT_1104584 [Mycena crocata]
MWTQAAQQYSHKRYIWFLSCSTFYTFNTQPLEMVTFSTFFAVLFVFRCAGLIPGHVARQDPTLTTSISGISAPTSTAPAVVDAYQNVLQKCGPDLDSAKQTALEEYNEDVISQQSGAANVTDPNNPQFLTWAGVNAPVLNQAQDVCVGAKNELAKAESTETTSSSPASSSPTGSSLPIASSSPASTSNPVTSPASGTTIASSTGASAPSSSLPGDGVRLNSQPMFVFAGLIGIMVGLN